MSLETKQQMTLDEVRNQITEALCDLTEMVCIHSARSQDPVVKYHRNKLITVLSQLIKIENEYTNVHL